MGRTLRWCHIAILSLPYGAAALAEPVLLASPESAIPATSLPLPTMDALAAAARLTGEEEVFLLGVEDCIRLALGESRTVRIAQIRTLAAGDEVQAARGAFDPVLYGQLAVAAGRTSRRGGGDLGSGGLLTRLTESDIDSQTNSGAAGLRGQTPTGAEYRIEWMRGRARIEPPFPARHADTAIDGVSLTVSQPLLRGVGIAINRATVRKAQAGRAATEAGRYQTQQDTVAGALSLYWNLVGLSESLTVREAAVRTAEKLLEDTTARRELGAGSDLDVLTSKSGLARRQNDYIETFAALGAASDQLKELLDLREGSHLLPARVVPADAPPVVDVAGLDLDRPMDARVDEALARRPELYIVAKEVEVDRIDLRVRRNDRLPSVDLYGKVEHTDRAEESPQRLTTPLDQEDTRWEIGLEGGYALGNRTARALHARAKHTLAAREEDREATRTAIMREVSDAVRQARKSVVLLENAGKTVELERARFEAEEARYQFGESTPFQLLLVQDNLIAEQTRHAVANAGLQAAVVALYRAQGILLDKLAPDVPPFQPEPADTAIEAP